ncbi:MAG TPA: hypothetical protein VFM25_06845 [Verrucomicrobiae bacterium]|nr:hypothetical protein [Verrucomicrobiae bacterium]
MNIQDRLKIFYDRLTAAQAAADAEAALALICRTLEEVENEFCPLEKKNPPPESFDGRMYLPQKDNMCVSDNQTMWVKTRKHRIAIKPDDSFTVFSLMPHRVLFREFHKPGQ